MKSSEFSTAIPMHEVERLLGAGHRLLVDGETFEPGDEMFSDAILEWLPLPLSGKTTMKWYASQYVPVRRRLPNDRNQPRDE